MPIISVIIPVYNCKKYLKRCIESVIGQTLKDIEVILVDDGSTDESKIICKEYAKKDTKIKLITQKNMGVSAARNAGLDNAKGKYIGFVDSDDFIEKNMYEILYKILLENNADISVCGIKEIRNEEESKNSLKSKEELFLLNKEKAMEFILSGKLLTMYSVNKLYKRELFENLRYPVGKIYEDTVLSTRIFSIAEKIVYTSEILYYYVRNSESITLQKFSSQDMDIISSGEYVLSFIKEKTPSLIKAAEFRNFWSYLHVLDKMILKGINENNSQYYKVMIFIKKNWINIILNPYFSLKRKLGTLILFVSNKAYRKMIMKSFIGKP